MKKLLKSEICASVNSAHHTLFTEKVKHFDSKKKEKLKHKTCVWEAQMRFPKRTLNHCCHLYKANERFHEINHHRILISN